MSLERVKKNKTPITHIFDDEWVPVLKHNRHTLSAEHVFCRAYPRKTKVKQSCSIRLSIGNVIADMLEYKPRQNLLITINKTRPNLYMVRKIESGGYVIDKASGVSRTVMTVGFPAERADILPMGKTVAVSFDMFSDNTLVFDISKIVEY